MKKVILAILFAFCLCSQAWGATYYVSSDGAGGKTGADYVNRADISTFDQSSMSAGDTLYIAGTISGEQFTVGKSGTDGNLVTYASCHSDYGATDDDAGTIDRNSESGRCFDTDGHDYIVIQGLTLTDARYMLLIDSSHDVYVRNCEFDGSGVANDKSAIYMINGSYNITVGGAAAYANDIHDIIGDSGAGSVFPVAAHDVIISYNHIYDGTDGIVCDGAWTYNLLIEYNVIATHSEDGIDLKDTYDAIVRYNKVYSASSSGIKAQNDSHHCYIYGNYVYSCKQGFAVWDSQDGGDGTRYIYIFSNISRDNTADGISNYDDGTTEYIWIFNNTVSENGSASDGLDDCAMALAEANSTWTIKNNILYDNDGHNANNHQMYLPSAGAVFDYNCYYRADSWKVYYNGDYRNLAYLQGQGKETNAEDGDPGLTDAAGNDFTIASSDSRVVDEGVDMGTGVIATVTIIGTGYAVKWDFALGPSTDWTTTPPTIDILWRDDLGWDIGAYVYQATGEDPPTDCNAINWDTNFVAWYKFDGNGNDSNTKVGTYNLTASHGAGGATDPTATAGGESDCTGYTDLDESNEHYWYSSASNDITGDLSVFIDFTEATVDDGDYDLLAGQYDTTNDARVWNIQVVGDGDEDNIRFYKGTENGADYVRYISTYDLAGDAVSRYRFAVTYDTSEEVCTIEIYNAATGASLSTQTPDRDGDAGAETDSYESQEISIGAALNGTAGAEFYADCTIHEVAIFNDLLTADERDELGSGNYSSPAPGSPTGLTIAGDITQSGTHIMTLTLDRETYVEGEPPYFDVTFDYPVTAVRYYYSGKSGAATYWSANLSVGYRQNDFDDDDLFDDNITLPSGTTWTDAQDNSVDVTGILSGITYPSNIVAIPFPDNNRLSFTEPNDMTAMQTAGFYFVAGDHTELGDNVTCDWNTSGGGSLGNPSRFFGHGFTMTGNLTIDEDYWEFDALNVTGSITFSADHYKWE